MKIQDLFERDIHRSINGVVKAEQHWYEGYNLDQVVSIMAPAAKNQYFLISVSTAF